MNQIPEFSDELNPRKWRSFKYWNIHARKALLYEEPHSNVIFTIVVKRIWHYYYIVHSQIIDPRVNLVLLCTKLIWWSTIHILMLLLDNGSGLDIWICWIWIFGCYLLPTSDADLVQAVVFSL